MLLFSIHTAKNRSAYTSTCNRIFSYGLRPIAERSRFIKFDILVWKLILLIKFHTDSANTVADFVCHIIKILILRVITSNIVFTHVYQVFYSFLHLERLLFLQRGCSLALLFYRNRSWCGILRRNQTNPKDYVANKHCGVHTPFVQNVALHNEL